MVRTKSIYTKVNYKVYPCTKCISRISHCIVYWRVFHSVRYCVIETSTWDLCGMAVSTAVTLASLLVALTFYLVGFSSVGWETFPGFFIDGSTRSSPVSPATAWLGLWSTCVCASVKHDYKDTGLKQLSDT